MSKVRTSKVVPTDIVVHGFTSSLVEGGTIELSRDPKMRPITVALQTQGTPRVGTRVWSFEVLILLSWRDGGRIWD